MKIIDVGEQATGWIAIGQQATGFFALGQMATGVIAIGQLARGVIAIGQLGVGLIGWGQGGVGIMHAVGMLGVGGRGFGIVLPLVPSLGRARVPPLTTSLQAIQAGQPGWISAWLAPDQYGLGLYEGSSRLPVKLDRRVLPKGKEITQEGAFPVFASVHRVGSVLVCDRMVYEPLRPYKKTNWWILGAFQLLALLILGVIYWPIVGNELLNFTRKALDSDSSPPAVAPSTPSPTPRTRK